MSRKIRLLSAISAAALLLASCGGGESTSRTKNSALCYDTQEAKDEAIQLARDAFDAAMGGGTPGDPLSDTTVPATEDSVVDEAPSDTVVTDSTSADGGGYRRPAVRAASSGDTSVPADEEGALTPEQQQAQMDLETAENQPLCETSGEVSQEVTCEITFTVPSDTPAVSTCAELDIDLDTRNTAAIEWTATVDSQTVASGVWDSVSENTKVVTFSYMPQSDSGSDEAMSTVTCTGTMSGSAENAVLSDDCPDGFVYSSLSADGMIWVLNKNGNEMGAEGAVLASGPLDISGLTPETPVTFKISYDIASQGVSSDTTVADGEDSPCSMTLSSTGISWSCSDGSLFNVAIEDMSNRGVYPLVECASEGSFTVAENQQFWFNFYLVSGEQTFLDGYNTDRPQGEPIGFTVPEDTEGVCTQSTEEDPVPSLLMVPGTYGFTANDTGSTFLNFYTQGECSNENNFAINWYVFNPEIEHYEYSSTSHPQTVGGGEIGFLCSYYDDSTYGGDWIAEFVGTPQIAGMSQVAAITNVELSEADSALIETVLPELGEMPNSYTFDGAFAQYNFVLTEETRVSITVNSNQSCDVSEVDDEENGFVDPEIYLYSGNAPWSESNDNYLAEDDNSYHSADNCSAAFLDELLPAGNYFIWAENDDFGDGDTGTITVNSSVELEQYLLDMDSIEFTTLSATVPSAVNIDVPSGGGHFVATLEAPDDSCDDYADPYLVVLDLSNGATIALDDDSAEDFLGLNCYSSLIDVDLAEGKYLLIITTYNIIDGDLTTDDPESGAGSVFELKYGFIGNEGSQEQIVVEPSNDPIPPVQVPPTADLPVEQLKSGSNSTLAVDEGVSTMVCSSTCVEDLFALEGVTGDVLTVSVGSESIVVKRGASKVRVPVSAGAKELVVTQKTASGATEVVSSTKVITAPANLGSTSTSTSSESGSNLLVMVVLGLGVLVIAGAGTTLVRRRKAN